MPGQRRKRSLENLPDLACYKNRVYERKCALEGKIEFVGQWQHIENAKSAAHQSFAAAWIPCKSYARLEIPKRRIMKERRSDAWQCIRQVLQIGNSVMRL